MSLPNLIQPTERRHWPRLDEELLIICRSRSYPKEAIYFTRNISGGGLMFESPEAMPPATRLEIELNAPMDCEKRTLRYIRIQALVRWINEITEAVNYEGSNRYRFGVTFDQVGPQDQACIDEYVKKRLAMAGVRSSTTADP